MLKNCSRYTNKGAIFAECFVGTILDLLNERDFMKRNANSTDELSKVLKKCNYDILFSTKMTPLEAAKKSNENVRNSNKIQKRKKGSQNLG